MAKNGWPIGNTDPAKRGRGSYEGKHRDPKGGQAAPKDPPYKGKHRA